MSLSDPKIQRQLFIRRYATFIFLGVAVIAICGATFGLVIRSFQGERNEPFVTDPALASVRTLVELEDEKAYPEAITVGNDGNIYSGSFCTGEIWQITPDGELSIWLEEGAGVASVSGMAFNSQGVLYVVDHGDCDPRRSVSSLKRVLPDGTVEDFGIASDDEIPNGLAFDRDDRLYVVDTQAKHIRTYDDEGQWQVWFEFPDNVETPLPTGIAYDADNHDIIAADSATGTILRLPIDEDGTASEFEVLYSDRDRDFDGLTLDDEGRVILTSYAENEVLRVDTDGTFTVLAKNFRTPSDVAYLDGRIYVTNFDAISLAPLISIFLDPSLPFTIDVIELMDAE